MKRRAEMLGLDAPVRLAGPGGGPVQVEMTLAEAIKMATVTVVEGEHGKITAGQ
jgi:hypothetical protein